MKQIRVRPGVLIVFEGLDKAGKSTQVDLFRRTLVQGTADFPHMPSGETAFTRGVYRLLEDHPPRSGLGRQLAHLSCHCENVPGILVSLDTKAVVLDRWWWSTMAYGWFSGEVPAADLSEAAFRELVQKIWEPITASVIFLFLSTREEDPNNASGVETGYRELARRQSSRVVVVPDLPVKETHQFIIERLSQFDLLDER